MEKGYETPENHTKTGAIQRLFKNYFMITIALVVLPSWMCNINFGNSGSNENCSDLVNIHQSKNENESNQESHAKRRVFFQKIIHYNIFSKDKQRQSLNVATYAIRKQEEKYRLEQLIEQHHLDNWIINHNILKKNWVKKIES